MLAEVAIFDSAKTVLDNVTSAISVADVASMLGIGLAAAVGFVALWFGGRKLLAIIMGAVKKGRASI